VIDLSETSGGRPGSNCCRWTWSPISYVQFNKTSIQEWEERHHDLDITDEPFLSWETQTLAVSFIN
jgi:hypothetical protein